MGQGIGDSEQVSMIWPFNVFWLLSHVPVEHESCTVHSASTHRLVRPGLAGSRPPKFIVMSHSWWGQVIAALIFADQLSYFSHVQFCVGCKDSKN